MSTPELVGKHVNHSVSPACAHVCFMLPGRLVLACNTTL